MKFLNVIDIDTATYQNYLDELGGYSFFHSKMALDYYTKSTGTENKSFFCFEQKELIGFAPLGLNTKKDHKTFSFNETPCHLPIIKQNIKGRVRKKYLREIFFEIYKKMEKFNVSFVDFFYHPISFNQNNILADYKNSFSLLNYFDLDTVTINLNLLDLTEDKKTFDQRLYPKLRQEFRKEKYQNLNFNIFNTENSSKKKIEEQFEKYKEYHYTSAGRVTRPKDSWDTMLKYLLTNESSLFSINNNENDLSYLLCFEHKNFSIGASQVNISNPKILKEFMLRHFLEYNVINYYRNKKFHFYEIGKTYFFDKLFKTFEQKHKRVGISKLKFGSDLYPVHFFRFNKKNDNIFDEKHKFVIENEF